MWSPLTQLRIAQVLQIAHAYDRDKRMLQKQLVRRHGMSFMPNIYVADDERHSDQVLTMDQVKSRSVRFAV